MKTVYYVEISDLEKGIQESNQYEITQGAAQRDDGSLETFQMLWLKERSFPLASDMTPWFFSREEAVAFAESIRDDRIAKLQALEF
jgi:hypothetical protein